MPRRQRVHRTVSLARRYREQPVLAVWEGSGNVIALDVLRALVKQPTSAEAFDAEMATALGRDERYDAQVARMRDLLSEVAAHPESAERNARRLVESMALTLQAQVLLTHAPSQVADAFLAGRVDPVTRSAEYGTLGEGVDVDRLVERA